ncbi:MAG: response regulator [Candidatus Bathyarchaeia archaeon]
MNEKILVVDDDESVRTVFSTELTKAGYIVEAAESGKQAIQKANAEFYNLALIDIRLPDMQGTELLVTLKQTTPKMRKIIVTGYPDVNNAIDALNRDADGYLTKPVALDTLLTKVKEQLEIQRGEEEYGQKKSEDFFVTKLRKNT